MMLQWYDFIFIYGTIWAGGELMWIWNGALEDEKCFPFKAEIYQSCWIINKKDDEKCWNNNNALSNE